MQPGQLALAVVVFTPLLAWSGLCHGQAPFPVRAQDAVAALDTVFAGPHPGARAVHAKGLVLRGRFIPAEAAAAISRAPHLAGDPVDVVVRFSDFAGVPGVPDGSAGASPYGMAIRFMLPGGADTDIVAHSYDGFPAATPADFVEFLRAVPDEARLAALAAERPAVRAFVEHPRPTPAGFATECFFGVNAFRFTNAEGVSRFGRYRLSPLAGARHLNRSEAEALHPDHLAREMAQRLAAGPVGFALSVQLAGDGDVVTDGSVPWPPNRPVVRLGTIELDRMPPDQVAQNAGVKFQPTNLVDGIAPSRDPMLLFRTQAYRLSADRRGQDGVLSAAGN